MSWHTIKIDAADTAFSLYIREKANWTCEKCGMRCKIQGETFARLEASHYHGRGKESTRFDEENVVALCSGCHKRMGGHKKAEDGEYDLFMKERLGERRYYALLIRANTTCRKDRAMALIVSRRLLADLRKERSL